MVPRVPNQAAVTLSPVQRAAASHSVGAFATNPCISDGLKFGRMSATDVNRNMHVEEFLLLVVAVWTVLHHTLSKGLF